MTDMDPEMSWDELDAIVDAILDKVNDLGWMDAEYVLREALEQVRP